MNNLKIELNYKGISEDYFSEIKDEDNEELENTFSVWVNMLETAILDAIAIKMYGSKLFELIPSKQEKVKDKFYEISNRIVGDNEDDE